MKLPFSLPFGKKEKAQYFLSLLLRDEKANAVIFEEREGKAHVVGEHEEHFNETIELASIEEWLDVLDKAISAAESSLPPNIETQKTIFGVKENWVEDGKIKREYLVRLKKVSDALGLAPIGFLVIHEAIAHLLSEKEGVPVSAILVELGKKTIAVSLIRAGRIVETKRTKSEDAIAATTDRILHHFTQHEILPSRIIVFNGRDHEELSQEFIGHAWSKSLPFLHVPQITTLPNGFDARAVLFGAATQMGFELLGAQDTLPEGPHIIKEEMASVPDKDTSPEEFGFLLDADVASNKKKEEQEVTQVTEYNLEEEEKKEAALLLVPMRIIKNALLSVYRNGFGLAGKSFPIKNKLLFLPAGIVIFGIVIILLYVFFLKATVVITIDPKVVKQDQAVVLTPGQPTDFEKHIIQVEAISVSEDGSVTTPATGKKEVGDKAKGTVTIYNSNLSEGKTLTKGTIITSSNGLQFSLDNGVTVASASGDASAITPSTAKVFATAQDIGKESNLPSGTKFTIANLSQNITIAKNDTAFAGGSKKEITVVAKADIEKLLADLPKNLEEKAKKNIEQKVEGQKMLIPGLIKTTVTKKEFGNDAGEEAATVSLKGTVSYDAFMYDKEDLTNFSKNVVGKGKDSALIPADDGVVYDFKDVAEKKNATTATLFIKASLVPKIEQQKLRQDIAGKTFIQAKSILRKIPQVKDVDINLWPQVPFLPQLLPKKAQNITFVLQTND